MVFQRDELEIHSQLFPIATWKVGTSKELAFPVTSIKESGGNRIVERERPYRDGAKLDDTGSKAKRWTMDAIFENTIDEPGLEVNDDVSLYPDILDEIISSFDSHETGDLVIPTRGSVRARAESYSRTENTTDRDAALLQLNFVQDNEDNVDAASFTLMSANATAERLGEVTTFDSQFDEMWDQNLRNIERSSQKLESVSNKPGEVSNDVDDAANVVTSAAYTVARSFTNPGKVGRNQLLNPETSKTQRKLVLNQDVAYRAKYEARRGRPQMISIVSSDDQTLFSIAIFFNQSVTDLISINPKIGNPNYIPKGTVVNILYVPAA